MVTPLTLIISWIILTPLCIIIGLGLGTQLNKKLGGNKHGNTHRKKGKAGTNTRDLIRAQVWETSKLKQE